MITREDYNKALDVVEAYHKQLFIGGNGKRFGINQKVIWDGIEVWVLEINEDSKMVLIATDRNEDHPQYECLWTKIEEVNAC